MIEWDRESAYLFFPKGSQAGIKTRDLGENTLYDGASNPFRGYEYQVQLKMGLAVADDRAVQRLANIESAGLGGGGSANNLTEAGVINLLVKAKNQLPKMGTRNTVLYVNRTTKTQMDVWALDKSNAYFTMESLQNGSMQTRFQGIPVRVIEQIGIEESAVS
jgi:hypothetical protein